METLAGMKHPAFQEALALLKASERQKSGLYLAEDLVDQALELPRGALHAVFATPEVAAPLNARCLARGVPLYVAGAGLLSKLVGTGYDTAVTSVAVVQQRRVQPEQLLDTGGLILAAESIQDPRNVGVLVRTADAAGCAGLLLSADSAEPYARPAVRSTTGSALRLPIAVAPDLAATLAGLRARGARVIASSGASKLLASALDLRARPLVLVVGNEQSGISEGVAAQSDAIARLPMAADTRADSYNVTVAAGMLVYEAIRGAKVSLCS